MWLSEVLNYSKSASARVVLTVPVPSYGRCWRCSASAGAVRVARNSVMV